MEQEGRSKVTMFDDDTKPVRELTAALQKSTTGYWNGRWNSTNSYRNVGEGDFYIWNMLFIYEYAIEEQNLGILTGLEKYNFNGN